MNVYLDAAPSIYLVERVPPYYSAVQSRLSSPHIVLFASELTRMECLVQPIREGNDLLIGKFDEFFQGALGGMVSLTREVMDRAAEIRARHRFRTPDAIHLAAAVVSGCDLFLTNDHRLRSFTDIAVEVLQP